MSIAAVPAPTTIEAMGTRRNLLEETALKIIYFTGEMTLRELSNAIKLIPSITEELFQRLRKDQLCEVTGMVGPMPRIQTTSRGKTRALELLQLSQYAGPAPVSLDDYVRRVRAQSVRGIQVHAADLKRAFAHLVLDDAVLTQLGTAITSGRAIFLYGSTGSGKTSVAESITKIFHQDLIWLPYAIEVDGQIITVYDAHLHEPADYDLPQDADRRWVLCHRPKVNVGGELTMEMLELQYNPLTRFYTAPVQVKANNGILIIDDFGRQRIRPDELLNRWVVPLDRGVDYLSLAGGKKIEIPFDMFVAFASNLEVGKLGDEAFLRRIQTKVRLDCITKPHFREIFIRACQELALRCDPILIDRVIDLITHTYRQPLRACYPRDVLNQVCWSAKYLGKEPQLDERSIQDACRNYFINPENETENAAQAD